MRLVPAFSVCEIELNFHFHFLEKYICKMYNIFGLSFSIVSHTKVSTVSIVMFLLIDSFSVKTF
jgi:hypothetical protein